MKIQLMVPMLAIAGGTFAADDPVVEAAKQGTRVAVKQTKRGTAETVKAVRTAAEWMSGNALKPSSEDIAKARKSGLVWADHQNWVYYKDGPSYGRTDTGEFWTEDGAKGAGYKLVVQTEEVKPAKPEPQP